MKYARSTRILAAMFATSMGLAHAGELVVPHSFSANTPAVAAQVNANFSAVQTAVNDNDARIATLEAALTAMQGIIDAQATAIAALQGNSVLDLDGVLELVIDPATGRPTARFSSVNVQVTNGVGTTGTGNGVGNLIVGYNEQSGTTAFCSNGEYNVDQTECEAHGGIWAANQRSGSHNLVLGNGNAYSSYGGLLAGTINIANNRYVSVSGGSSNTASGDHASVSGGAYNIASGSASVFGGGRGNTASGMLASVSGGGRNVANQSYSSITGGDLNTASGKYAAVCGGRQNTASGSYASVSGGLGRIATGQYDWRAGALFEEQ